MDSNTQVLNIYMPVYNPKISALVLYHGKATREPSGEVQFAVSINSIKLGEGSYGRTYDITLLCLLSLLTFGYMIRSFLLVVVEFEPIQRIIYAGRLL